VCRHDKEILGSQELRWQDSGIAADEISDDALQEDGTEESDHGDDASDPAPSAARNLAS
jgi:hypothetical protein